MPTLNKAYLFIILFTHELRTIYFTETFDLMMNVTSKCAKIIILPSANRKWNTC